MGETEKKELLKSMQNRTKKAKTSKKAALAYLTKLGVLDKKGSLTKNYNELCTTHTQG
jgi:DNA-directed RNA polymerase subunit F